MDQFNRLIELAEDLTALLPHRAKPGVAIMGAFNAGKSTLVNGLLGAEISPVGVIPTTSCLMTFEYGDSFQAGYSANKGNLPIKDLNQLPAFLKKGLTTPQDMAVLQYPSPFLKICRLIDTPGLDSWQEAGDLVELAALEADYVIYLFHQRGIEDLNRLFLYRLAEIWKKRDIKKLTFLLNCNQGVFDGSSLETTRKLLREIFLYPVRCQSINTHSPDDIEALKKFLQLQLALDTCRSAAGYLKKLDQALPQRLRKAAGIKDDPTFLSEYWQIHNTARIILETGSLLHSLPMVSGQLEHNLRLAGQINAVPRNTSGFKSIYPRLTNILDSKNRLLALTGKILAANINSRYINLPAIEKVAQAIRQECFTIGILGGFSSGKTTFINALLKEDLLPTADGPTTAVATRITYGPDKKAYLHYPLQITLRVCEQVGEKIGICREQLKALEHWLAPDNREAVSFEWSAGDFFHCIDQPGLLDRVHQLKEHFSVGAFARATAARSIPHVFKLAAPRVNKKNNLLTKVRLTFQNDYTAGFNLSDPADAARFRKALVAANALRIDRAWLEHPADILRQFVFLDTPGFDWIQKHHLPQTASLLQQCDAYLVFLNGKHILNQMDRQNLQAFFYPQGDLGKKYFFVINFADLLSFAEQEAVSNFVRKNLATSNVFLISALKARSGEDLHGISPLLRKLAESIFKHRAKDFYLEKIAELLEILSNALRRLDEACHHPDTGINDRLRFNKAVETVRGYRRDLKELRNFISSAQPP